MDLNSVYSLLVSVIVVGLSQLTYQVSEGPNAVATVCATIEVALGSVSKDTIVNLVTPLSGAAVTGELTALTMEHSYRIT